MRPKFILFDELSESHHRHILDSKVISSINNRYNISNFGYLIQNIIVTMDNGSWFEFNSTKVFESGDILNIIDIIGALTDWLSNIMENDPHEAMYRRFLGPLYRYIFLESNLNRIFKNMPKFHHIVNFYISFNARIENWNP